MVLQFLFSVLLVIAAVKGNPCNLKESVNITGGTLTNGSVVYQGIAYSAEEWYSTEEEGVVIWYGCPCIRRTCLWKCCGQGEAFLNRSCNSTSTSEVNPFLPPTYNGTSLVADTEFHLMYNKLCDERYLVDSTDLEIYIQQNGSFLENDSEGWMLHAPTDYCTDFLLDGVSEPRQVAAVCYLDSAEEESSLLHGVYAIGLLLSAPFLLCTILVYAVIPELRNLHGMCLMAYCAGLLVAYVFLAYLKLHSGEIGIDVTTCLVIPFIIYYSFQTSFFWLNVMCFDIWRTFSGYRGSSNKRRDLKRFAWYGLYAWGVPMVLTAVTAGMQFADDLPDWLIRPSFAKRKCWFESWLSELFYFFGPVLVLVVCNVALFAITANRIRSIRQETAILKGAESARSDRLKRDKQRYALYLKLFMVMGVNWTVELISFGVGGSDWYWVLTDISNIGLGFFIFMIFVWKNKVRNLIKRRFRSVRGAPPADSSLGRWATRSSAANTEDTRISSDDAALRMKEMH